MFEIVRPELFACTADALAQCRGGEFQPRREFALRDLLDCDSPDELLLRISQRQKCARGDEMLKVFRQVIRRFLERIAGELIERCCVAIAAPLGVQVSLRHRVEKPRWICVRRVSLVHRCDQRLKRGSDGILCLFH
nr:hypothetical protein [Leucobacter chromiireducens]